MPQHSAPLSSRPTANRTSFPESNQAPIRRISNPFHRQPLNESIPVPSGIKGEMDPQSILNLANNGIPLSTYELVRLVQAGAKLAGVRVPHDRQMRNIIAAAEDKFRAACRAAGLECELLQPNACRVGIRTMSKLDVDELLNGTRV